MLNGARGFLRRFAAKVLDIDDTVRPESQLRMFEDYLDRFNFDTDTKDVVKFLRVLKKKHLVDDIVVASMNGSSIASTNGNAVSQAVSGAAIFNYISSELPKSETIMIKANGWHMLIPVNKKLYIVKAASDLTPVELRALAKEIDTFLAQSS